MDINEIMKMPVAILERLAMDEIKEILCRDPIPLSVAKRFGLTMALQMLAETFSIRPLASRMTAVSYVFEMNKASERLSALR